MRKYTVFYLKEINDECVDCEIDVFAENIFLVEQEFRKEISRFKRVTDIREKVINRLEDI